MTDDLRALIFDVFGTVVDWPLGSQRAEMLYQRPGGGSYA